MVLEYWDNYAYSYFPTGHILIDALANAMKTNQNGSTMTEMIDNGIETVSHTYVYNNFDAVTENSVTAAKVERN